jgi:hypothetical protein
VKIVSSARCIVELAHLRNSSVKGHHVFRSDSRPGNRFLCERQRSNTHSDVAIAVKRGSRVIGYVPERLARILSPMLEDGRIRGIDGWLTGPERPAPEGVWTRGGGVELPCCYVLHGLNESRKGVRKCLRESCKKKNNVKNFTIADC